MRAAVKHVVGNIFNDAPVNIRLGCYPKSSPKAGERLVLMTLNKLVISEQEKQSKNEGRSAAGFALEGRVHSDAGRAARNLAIAAGH